MTRSAAPSIGAFLPALAVGAVIAISVLAYLLFVGTREPCLAAPLAERLQRPNLWIGGKMGDPAFRSAPFDLRYVYLAGGVPLGQCDDCRTCDVGEASCRNPAPCPWWGCWQADDQPPGRYVVEFVRATEAAGALPMITWYEWLTISGGEEGSPEIRALSDAARVERWVTDWERVLDAVVEATSGPVILHIEPDLLAFAAKEAATPHDVVVAVPARCGQPATLAGAHQCLIALARSRAPNVLVASHASSWGAGADAFLVTDPAYDVGAHAVRTAAFVREAGAGDLVVVETSHRDAGFDGRWWGEERRPDFATALGWARALSRALGVPHLWWQVPYGNERLPDTCGRYRDNRVDHVFDHPGTWADGTTLGVAFGDGAACMTTPSTDDGHFLARAEDWFDGERVPLCR